MEERKLPIGIQSFEDIRQNGYVYIDKTAYIWDLVESGKVYFLSRPRRFGKSLFTRTLEAYFEGRKDLFKDLSIEKLENSKGSEAWQKYPVIYFSLASGKYNTENGLEDVLSSTIEEYRQKYDVDLLGETLPVKFRYLIERIYQKTGRRVVVLVDEYDKPLLETMEINPGQEEKNRDLFRSFFSVLKDEDQCLKFVFITGLTKFSKISVFSDLNQLNDISLTNRFSSICGITEEELKNTFQPEIKNLARMKNHSEKETLKSLARMYDGYHFSGISEGVYNPFSILKAFYNNDYGSYWYSTGTPTFLVNSLKKSRFTAEQLTDGVEVSEAQMTDYRADSTNPIPLLYQAGYLTISDYDQEFRIYTLHFPNEEVRYGFMNSLLPSVIGERDADNPTPLRDMILALRTGNVNLFIEKLKGMFASIPYIEGSVHSYEQEWRNEVYLILAMLGQNARCEVHTAMGRADCIIETKQDVYVLEFKLDSTADKALQQIKDKKYAESYISDNRKINLVGINFSSETRNISEWKAA